MNCKTSGRARELLLLLIVTSVFCSCATTLSKKASLVREAKDYLIEDCEFLGTVQGWSGWGGAVEAVGIQNAKNQALERAASLGATHIVWVDIRGGPAPVTRARAYSCEQREQVSTAPPYHEAANVAVKGKSKKADQTVAGTVVKEKLAVMDLKAKYGVKEGLAEGLSVVVRDTIQGFGNYEVISKEDVEAVAERTVIRQSLGCDDTQCLINIGRSLGTRFMVAGAISKFGDTFNISLRLIDTEGKDAGVKKRVNRNCQCADDELIEIAQVTAYLLLGRDSYQTYNSGEPSQSAKVRAPKSGKPSQSGKVTAPKLDGGDFVVVKKTGKELFEEKNQKLSHVPETETRARVHLRKESKTLEEFQVQDTVRRYNFYESSFNPLGSFGNDFVDNGDGTIIDKATGLMWEKRGSPSIRSFKRSKFYVGKLNEVKFAGYSNWRLPTVEELASLLRKDNSNGIHIDPVFSKKQKSCWSADIKRANPPVSKTAGEYQSWIINFAEGIITMREWSNREITLQLYPNLRAEYYIRAVRSLK